MILTDEQKSIKEAARRFSHERLLPTYLQRELDGNLDRSLIREIGRLGFIGVDLPVELGGLGLDGGVQCPPWALAPLHSQGVPGGPGGEPGAGARPLRCPALVLLRG